MTPASARSGALRYRLRVELRGRWKAWLALAVAIGIAGGVAVAAAAGARRTQSAYPRFLDSVEVEDAIVGANVPEWISDGDNPFQREIERLPQVERSGRSPQLVTIVADTAEEAVKDQNSIGSLALLDGFGYAFGRPRLLAGRMPNRHRADEVLVNRPLRTRTTSRSGVGSGSGCSTRTRSTPRWPLDCRIRVRSTIPR